MSLYRRPNSSHFWCRFTIRGTEIRQSTGTSNRQNAEEFETELRSRYWRQIKLGESFHTFGDATKAWLAETDIKTKGKDEQILTWLCDQKDEQANPIGLRNVPLREITYDVIMVIRDKLNAGNLSKTTVNHYLGTLRKVLRKAHFEWKTDGRPWLEVLPKVPMFRRVLPDPIWVTRAQLRKLLKELPEHSCDMALFAVATGLRKANVVGLCKDRIDRRRRIAWVEGSTAKGKRGIAVPLNSDAMAIIAKWWHRHETHIFSYQGHPIRDITTAAWRKAVRRAELDPRFTFHKCRHTWASWQVQSGTPLSILKELGAWADYQMVERYAHLHPGHLKAYAGRTLLGTPKNGTAKKRA